MNNENINLEGGSEMVYKCGNCGREFKELVLQCPDCLSLNIEKISKIEGEEEVKLISPAFQQEKDVEEEEGAAFKEFAKGYLGGEAALMEESKEKRQEKKPEAIVIKIKEPAQIQKPKEKTEKELEKQIKRVRIWMDDNFFFVDPKNMEKVREFKKRLKALLGKLTDGLNEMLINKRGSLSVQAQEEELRQYLDKVCEEVVETHRLKPEQLKVLNFLLPEIRREIYNEKGLNLFREERVAKVVERINAKFAEPEFEKFFEVQIRRGEFDEREAMAMVNDVIEKEIEKLWLEQPLPMDYKDVLLDIEAPQGTKTAEIVKKVRKSRWDNLSAHGLI